MGLFDSFRKRYSAATQPQEQQPVTDNAATDNQEIAPSNTQFDMDAKQLLYFGLLDLIRVISRTFLGFMRVGYQYQQY